MRRKIARFETILLGLIQRLDDPQQGEILIDGTPLCEGIAVAHRLSAAACSGRFGMPRLSRMRHGLTGGFPGDAGMTRAGFVVAPDAGHKVLWM